MTTLFHTYSLDLALGFLSGAVLASSILLTIFHGRRRSPLRQIALQMLATIERDNRYLPEIIETIRRAIKS